jgi:nucleotide-binding universal stress UspA family protein
MTAKPVVAATDGSAGSLLAIEWAAGEAVLRSAPLRIISAASLPKMVLLPLQPEHDAALAVADEVCPACLPGGRGNGSSWLFQCAGNGTGC